MSDEFLCAAARDDFTTFKALIWPRYQHAPHLEIIDFALMLVELYIRTEGAEGVGRLRIEMPPRHGKTRTVSQLFPAWMIGKFADLRVLLASYTSGLSVKNSRAVRILLTNAAYMAIFPEVVLSEDSRSKSVFDIATPAEGGLEAVGKLGSVTGKGAHLLITDDLVKGRAEAESDNQRERDWQWFNDDIRTRLEPGAAHISIMTRWHTDDVHGRLQLYERDGWTVLKLPAVAEVVDDLLVLMQGLYSQYVPGVKLHPDYANTFRRPVGGALWASRFNEKALSQRRRELGEYGFSSLYQQSPIPRAGGIFKFDKFTQVDYWETDAQGRWLGFRHIVRFWDLALSERTSADYTVGLLMGQAFSGQLVVLDVQRFRVDWDDVVDKIVDVALRDGPQITIGVETAFFHTRAVKKLLARRELHNYVIKGYPPDSDKFTRALPFAARVGEGLVTVLKRSWTMAFLDELCAFPLAGHDDQVDTCSGAYLMLDKVPRKATVRQIGQAAPSLAEDTPLQQGLRKAHVKIPAKPNYGYGRRN